MAEPLRGWTDVVFKGYNQLQLGGISTGESGPKSGRDRIEPL